MPTASSIETLPIVPSTFPKFLSLPPEIRDIIWRVSAFPRIVYLEYVQEEGHKCSRVWAGISTDDPSYMGFFDLDDQPYAAQQGQGPSASRRCSLPQLFLVCKDSHMLAKNIYTMSFGIDYPFPSTWFNFEADVLYLDWGIDPDLEDENDIYFDFIPTNFSEDIKKVKKLAIYEGKHPSDISREEWIGWVLREFGNVQDLIMVPPRRN